MKNVLLLTTLALSLLFVGCTGGSAGAGNKAEPVNTPGNKAEPMFQVALITPGPVSDAGWNAMAYGALESIKKEMGAEISHQEAIGTKMKDSIRSYAQDGYQIVFGHGFEYNEPMAELAKDFPATTFISSSGGLSGKNYGAFRFYLEQGFYVCGYMAAKMSKTGKVAMIGGDDVPSIRSTFKGFAAGAKAANPNIEVIEKFTGNGKDTAQAKQATLAAISQGADFVIHQANAAAPGVFAACKEKGVWAFGANADQNSDSSGVVIASAVIDAAPAMVGLAKKIKAGEFTGGVALVGMSDNTIKFVMNPALKDKVPAELATELEKLVTDITSGAVVVPKDEF